MSGAGSPSRDRLLAGVLGVLTFSVFLASPVRQVTDSHFTLLLSESLIDHRSFALDRYFVRPLDPARFPRLRPSGLPSQVREAQDGHLYLFFPAGSSVLSAPFVALMNRWGWSTLGPDRRYDAAAERRMQGLLAAALMGAFTAVCLLTARLFLPPLPSLVAALVAALATPVWSTASRGLWSLTWQLLLIGLSLFQLAAHEARGRRLRPVLLATLLSWAYFVRPTSALFIAAVSLYLLRFERALFARYAATGALWLGAFVAYSLAHFGSALPPYYEAGRLSLDAFGAHLLGNLIAPSRGLLVFTPVLLVLAAWLLRHRQRLPAPRLLAASLLAIAAQLAVVSAFPDWAGGHSYGPRMTADLVPWLFLLGCIALAPALDQAPPASVALAAALCAWGVFVHARGALAEETWEWNLDTEIDANVSRRVWDWRHPQFLAGLVEPPRTDRAEMGSAPYTPGTRITAGDPASADYFAEGWGRALEGARWSTAREAVFAFSLDVQQPLVLRLRAAPYLADGRIERQRVRVTLNGTPLGEWTLSERGAAQLSLPVPTTALALRNLLVFEFPDARSPASLGQGRKRVPRSISLEWIELTPATPADRE